MPVFSALGTGISHNSFKTWYQSNGMKFGKHLIVLLFFSIFCIASASAAGTGVFSISNVGNVTVGETGVATVFVSNNWIPNFGDTFVDVTFDPAAVAYVSA